MSMGRQNTHTIMTLRAKNACDAVCQDENGAAGSQYNTVIKKLPIKRQIPPEHNQFMPKFHPSIIKNLEASAVRNLEERIKKPVTTPLDVNIPGNRIKRVPNTALPIRQPKK